MVWIITVDFLVSALQGLRNLHFMDLFSVFLLDLYVYLPVFQHLSAKIDKKLCMYIITQFYLNISFKKKNSSINKFYNNTNLNLTAMESKI